MLLRKNDNAKQAAAICQAYWGEKTIGTTEAVIEQLAPLKLSKSQINDLRYGLPYCTSGPTGGRIQGLNRCLKRLAN